jgi:hypothetical protein
MLRLQRMKSNEIRVEIINEMVCSFLLLGDLRLFWVRAISAEV